METHQEFVQDAILAVMFGILAVVSGYRSYLYFTLTGSGKVVTLFYLLIFTTSFVRCVWFGIPSLYLEGSYLPKATSE
jgi:ABC-type Mn2+/Zn2+ transport system permease subunit